MKTEDWKETLEKSVSGFAAALRRFIYDAIFVLSIFAGGYLGAQIYMDTHGAPSQYSRAAVLRPAYARTLQIEPIRPRHHRRKPKAYPLVPQSLCPGP